MEQNNHPENSTSTSSVLADQLLLLQSEIEKAFEQHARDYLLAAKQQDFPTLLDHLPDMVQALSFHLRHHEVLPAESREEKKASRRHGIQRANIKSYTMEQILAEYRLFRKVVFDVLEKHGPPVPAAERDIMLDVIQLGAKHAASQFIHTRVSQMRMLEGVPASFFIKLALAVFLVALATVIQWHLRDYIESVTYILYYPAVVIGAFVADPLMVTILAAVAAQYFFVNDLSIRMQGFGSYLRMALFLFNGVLISLVIKKLRTSQSTATESSNEQEIAKREMELFNRKLETERQLREQFVNTLTHDMRTPLTAIKASVHLLTRYPDRVDTQEKHKARILKGVDRIDHMIQDLLDVNSIRAGQSLPMVKEDCDICTIVEDAVEEQRLIHGNRVIFKSDGELESRCNPGGIRRIVENLISNALKYGASGRPVEVTLRKEYGLAAIRVRNELAEDQEPLSPDDIEALFKPFHRANDARESGKKGWGLGLTLVKGIAQAHGGTVDIQSSAEQGTVFTVKIPL